MDLGLVYRPALQPNPRHLAWGIPPAPGESTALSPLQGWESRREPCSALNPKPGAQPMAGPPLHLLVPGKVPHIHLQSITQRCCCTANPSSEQPWHRNQILEVSRLKLFNLELKNATMSSSRSFRRACCQNLYKQITLLSGIQQETEREIPFPGTLETYPEYSE